MAPRPTPAMATRNPVAARPPLARGRLVITGDITGLSSARLFAAPGQATGLWLHLPVGGWEGLAPPPLMLTFHTEDGPWDLPLRRLPVDFTRSPARRAALDLAAAEGQPALWDFCFHHPETLPALLHAFGDSAHPASWRQAAFFGAGTHSLARAGRQTWCRFRLVPLQDGTALGEGLAPACLFDALARGAPARWRLLVQIMTEQEARDAPFDAFDPTRAWPEGRWPGIEVGRVSLEGRLDLAPPPAAAARLVPGIAAAPSTPRRPRVPATPQEAGALFRDMDAPARLRLMDRLAAALRPLPQPLGRHLLGLFAEVDMALGAGLARRLRAGPERLAAE